MLNFRILASTVLAVCVCPLLAHADTVTIAGDPNAPTSNFQNPGNTATSGYTITTTGDGTSVIVSLTTSDLSAPDFANLYFETVANDPNAGSNLGFEASGTAVNDAFNPDTSQEYLLTGLSGFSSVETTNASGKTITVTLPDSFFETDPLGIGFPETPAGTDVSLHLSQSFGYSVVGGSADYPRPSELGLAQVGSAVAPTPEPATIEYMALSGIGLLAAARRRLGFLRRS